ncbi:uncharacterized protein LOC107847633 isoform X1 [Capsicum annuum]|uniref:uncharacterized protein LOC107847633 isoform X1 n=1 Tax=Capsicum annuum TaxID=4072 RepID=UPI001FB19070|nr:uncharacterized protein LOC107847633 isoform X1 [Capsicum annuum]
MPAVFDSDSNRICMVALCLVSVFNSVEYAPKVFDDMSRLILFEVIKFENSYGDNFGALYVLHVSSFMGFVDTMEERIMARLYGTEADIKMKSSALKRSILHHL